jgi:hypothetical protein
MNSSGCTLLTVAQFAEKHKNFTVSGLRWLLFKNHQNFRSCTLKIGRRLFIVEERFFEWLESKD